MKMNIKKTLLTYPFVFILSLLILLTFIFLGINIYFIIITILYILFYLIFIAKSIAIQFIKLTYKWFFLGAIILLSLIVLISVNPKAKATSSKPITPEQCKPIYEMHDAKIYEISGDGIKGTVGIKIDPNNCHAVVSYNILTTADLTKNYQIPNSGYSQYEYAASIRESGEARDSGRGMVQLQPVFENKTILPPDPYTFDSQAVNYGYSQLAKGASTNIFYHGWSSSYTFYESSMETLLSKTQYDIVDASEYVIKTPIEGFENAFSYSTDEDSACENGPIIKSIQLTYSERKN